MIPTAGELLSYSNSVLKTVHRPLPLDRSLAYRLYKAAEFLPVYPAFNRMGLDFWSFKRQLEEQAFPRSQWITEGVAAKILIALFLTSVKLDAQTQKPLELAKRCQLDAYCRDYAPYTRSFRLLSKKDVLKIGVI